jgi:hypothetical protein
MANEKTGSRCKACEKPVEENMKRTREGHAMCFPDQPVLRKY